MRCFVLLFVGCFLYATRSLGQCSSIDFNLPPSTCLEQEINLTSNPLLASYEWDFCPGDFDGIPEASVFQANAGAPFNVALIEHNGEYFGFYTSRTFGKLFRLDFGSDINSTPVPVDLGDLGVSEPVWLGIEIVEEGGNYYGFIADYFNKILRFDLGDSPANVPSPAVVFYADGLLANALDITFVEDETGKYAFIACLSSNRLVRVSFASSYAESSSASTIDDITISGSGNLSGISLMRECDQWYGFTTSLAGGQVTRIHFDSGLADDTPAIGQLSGLPITIEAPGGLAMVEEAGSYYLFIQAERASSNLYKLDFGSTFSGAPVSGTDFGNMGVLNEVFGFSMYKVMSEWLILGGENVGPRIFKVKFPSLCFSDQSFATSSSPTIVTNTVGSFAVSLTTYNASGYRESTTKNITVTNVAPPTVDFDIDGLCSSSPSTFTPQTDAAGSLGYHWHFGDGNTSTQQEPSHQFTTGDYDVEVTITTLSDGCSYNAAESVTIYNSPQADFDLPSGLICTNDSQTYTNQTPDLFDGHLSYEWLVDDVQASTQRNLVFAFTSQQDHDLKLIATIPGCSDEILKTVTGIETGPATGFTVTGACEEEAILFINTSTGAVGYEWTIDGNVSTLTDVTHIFTEPGTYTIALNSTGDNGCVTEFTEDVVIYSKPAPAFSLDLPPFSCAGMPSQFHDETPPLSDGNVESWSWTFADGGVGTGSDPQHTYLIAGDYQVGLTITTDRGCVNFIQQLSTISSTPDVTISHTLACEDRATDFTAISGTTVTDWHWNIEGTTYKENTIQHMFQTSGDHIVQVTATAVNHCQRFVEESVNVPLAPVFDFSFTNACAGQTTQFVSNLIASGEPTSTPEWFFVDDESLLTGPSVERIFDQAGFYGVQLRLAGASGCGYAINHVVPVHVTPVPAFTPMEVYGPAPLNVSFINTSVGGSTYAWQFHDGSGSVTDPSPSHTFANLGTYAVSMQVTSDHGCQASTAGSVYVIVPHTDLVNEELSFVDSGSGQMKAVVRVKNNSNYPIESFNVSIETGSGVGITETVRQTLPPMSEQTIVSATSLTFDSKGGFVCMTLLVPADENANNNKQCLSVDGEQVVFEPYPNPAQESLMIQYVGDVSAEIEIRLVNQAGADAYSKVVPVSPGLNLLNLDVSSLAPGVYVVRVITSASVLSSRVIIGH
jgi:PKD repeat protein